ncbi:MAG: hypothetical protein ACR5KV_05985 [Wolbachia sp.]
MCQQLKNNALSEAMDIGNEALVMLLLSAIEEKQEISNVKEIKAESGNNGNIGNRPVATASPVSTNGNNNKNEMPVSIGTSPTTTSNSSRRINNFTNAQPSKSNEKETKYKESKENFHVSLRGVAVGVVITGLFITAAVMVPSLVGALVCSILAILFAIGTELHVKNSTLPSYREMEENKVECVNLNLRNKEL